MTSVLNPILSNSKNTWPQQPALTQMEIVVESDIGEYWFCLEPDGRPNFNSQLLKDLDTSMDYAKQLAKAHPDAFQYMICSSRIPGVFNLGGDLFRFVELITAQDRKGLQHYAHACIQVIYRWAVNLGLPACTISLVQGTALGGGFECALGADVIIAEHSARFGLPESLFGMFPGMGAYHFLSNRVNPSYAERIILSGEIFTAEQMLADGVVDIVVDDGAGEDAVRQFIRRDRKRLKTRQALLGIREMVQPVTRQQLIEITEMWVDLALTLGRKELRKMKRFALAQDHQMSRV